MWTLDGNRIYVTDFQLSKKQTIAKLQPLVGGSVYHVFGYENPTYKVTFIIIGNDLDTISVLAQDGDTHTLITWEGVSLVGYINNFESKRSSSIWQTVKCPVTDVVWECSMELSIE